MTDPNQASTPGVPSSAEEVSAHGLQQAAELKRAQHRQALLANGFQLQECGTRRSIHEDLQDPHPGFPPGYKPTRAEIYNRTLGEDNWATVATGVTTEDPDPWGNETPDITEWQNQELEVFTRDPKS